ncbi:TPA: AbrB family transcriptional regulator [Bacillus cereus]
MKATGVLRKIDHLGRIVIPREGIILKKYKGYDVCPITGEVSFQNIKLGDGKLALSPEGAKQLMEELEQYLARA